MTHSDAGQYMGKPLILNRPYLEIPRLDKDNLGGIRQFIQRATNSYFMKIYKFQHLLGQNRPSIEIRKAVSGSSIDPSVNA